MGIESEKNVQARLHSLGVLPGKIISVIRNSKSRNPLVIEIEESRFVLSRELAKQIYVINILSDFIFDSHHKKTQQRILILNELKKQKGHFSLEQFTERVQKLHPTIGNVTIYRTLKLLIEKGILEVTELPSGSRKFEVKKGHHDHFICKDCGAIVDFENTALEKLQKQIAKSYQVELEGHELKLFTKRCAKCSRNRRSAEDGKTTN